MTPPTPAHTNGMHARHTQHPPLTKEMTKHNRINNTMNMNIKEKNFTIITHTTVFTTHTITNAAHNKTHSADSLSENCRKNIQKADH